MEIQLEAQKLEGQLLHQMLAKAGLTVMEAPHDQIRVESNQDGLDDLRLLQAAEDRRDGVIRCSQLQLSTDRPFHS